MPLSDTDLRDIVGRSYTLNERLIDNFICDPISNISLVKKRLQRWQETSSHGDKEKFTRRLRWSQLRYNDDFIFLGNGSIDNKHPLPEWVFIIQDSLALSESESFDRPFNNLSQAYPFLDSSQPLPFEHLFIPFIVTGRSLVKSQTKSASIHLTETATYALERALLISLTELSKQTLNLEFSIFRLEEEQDLGFETWLDESEEKPSTNLYQEYISILLQKNGLTDLFREYPVLCRLIATVTNNWVDAVAEFIQRLDNDYDDISALFSPDNDPGAVVGLIPSLSDPHHNGRTVFLLTFQSGIKLIYKPKDIGLEAAYNGFLDWINNQGVDEPHRVIKTIPRSGYGWVEFIDKSPCRSMVDISRFYKRAGRMLMLFYTLEATDVHFENLIASSDQPVLIDVETLLQPELSRSSTDENSIGGAIDVLRQSVLKTGMLPRWSIGLEGKAFDISGLGYTPSQETAFKHTSWVNMNSDRSHAKYEYRIMQNQSNVPVFENIAYTYKSYLKEVLAGFEEMYRIFITLKAQLLAPDGPLRKFNGLVQRHVFRHTKYYAVLQEKALNPDYMRNGIDRSIELEALAYNLLDHGSHSQSYRILEAECRSLENMDYPLFMLKTNTPDLTCPPVSDFFLRSGYDQVRARIDSLDEQDLQRQITIIRSTHVARFSDHAPNVHSRNHSDDSIDHVAPYSPEEKIALAMKIGEELIELAIPIGNGGLTWIGFQYMAEADRFQHGSIGYSLYSGDMGIALFFAALAHVTGNNSYRKNSLDILQSMRIELRAENRFKMLSPFQEIGGAVGLGGLVYGLFHTGELLSDQSLIDDAQYLVDQLDVARIGADRQFDIIGGSSGLILGLLPLLKKSQNQKIRDIVNNCSQHLLKNRINTEEGYKTWRTKSGIKPMTGFSHGAAGIALSLLRAFAVTGNDDYLNAAKEAVAFEQSVFQPNIGNWPDYRPKSIQYDGSPGCLVQWCHGAPGIGLARLSGLDIWNTPENRQAIDIALATTRRYGAEQLDHLCCGGMGRAEFLLSAGTYLDRPDLVKTAEQIAAHIYQRAQITGHFRLFEDWTQPIYNPGLFQGTAGIGYQLLRLAAPKSIPSVLAWD